MVKTAFSYSAKRESLRGESLSEIISLNYFSITILLLESYLVPYNSVKNYVNKKNAPSPEMLNYRKPKVQASSHYWKIK